MKTLNYEVLRESGYQGYILEDAPEKVMQFGEGNFLRAFVNYWFDISNEKAGWNGKDENGVQLMDFVLSIASGKQTKTEQKGFREISVFKDGVML